MFVGKLHEQLPLVVCVLGRKGLLLVQAHQSSVVGI